MGDEGTKERERELEVKACERERLRGDVSWNCKRRASDVAIFGKTKKKTLSFTY